MFHPLKVCWFAMARHLGFSVLKFAVFVAELGNTLPRRMRLMLSAAFYIIVSRIFFSYRQVRFQTSTSQHPPPGILHHLKTSLNLIPDSHNTFSQSLARNARAYRSHHPIQRTGNSVHWESHSLRPRTSRFRNCLNPRTDRPQRISDN